ncbi:hypothetical protein chiPu_0006915 [Chiloscyllium punctatum]|uniref:Uncharacterized protein n=1 Tax=Chiloscyllium punctatum TaxID=137246 RepID=A0A401SDL3_CHIPU|nr:hypothetical protein [Chiloscyllium punctatum]
MEGIQCRLSRSWAEMFGNADGCSIIPHVLWGQELSLCRRYAFKAGERVESEGAVKPLHLLKVTRAGSFA